MKYDDASWHYGGDFPDDLPIEAGGTHIGIFLSWCLLNGLGGALHEKVHSHLLKQLMAREITPGHHFLSACDEKFWDEDLNDEGNAFAQSYYAASNDQYLMDYSEVLGQSYPSLYHVPDSWESYDQLAPVISRRFEKWKSGSSRHLTSPHKNPPGPKVAETRKQSAVMPPVPDDYGVAYPVFDGEPLWYASKNRTYRENMRIRFLLLHEFLKTSGLYTDPDREFPEPAEFTIPRDALTDKGLIFVWRYLDKYLGLRQAETGTRFLQARLREMED